MSQGVPCKLGAGFELFSWGLKQTTEGFEARK